jgi:hypothetical protein
VYMIVYTLTICLLYSTVNFTYASGATKALTYRNMALLALF